VMGLDELRGPMIIDPYAKDKLAGAAENDASFGEAEESLQGPGSKAMSEVDSGVGLEPAVIA
jgi:hypothetical protein